MTHDYKRHGTTTLLAALNVATGDSTNVALGWENIRNLKTCAVCRRITDKTLPGGPFHRYVEYVAPFTRCDREQDYR